MTLWTAAHQAPQSMGFSRQEYWSGLPFPSPGDLPDPGIKPGSPTLEADALTSEPPGKPSNPNISPLHGKGMSYLVGGGGFDPHFPPGCNLSKKDPEGKEFRCFLSPSSPGPE